MRGGEDREEVTSISLRKQRTRVGLLGAAQEQWCSSCLGRQVALFGLGSLFRDINTIFFVNILKTQWEASSVTLAWLPAVALEKVAPALS